MLRQKNFFKTFYIQRSNKLILKNNKNRMTFDKNHAESPYHAENNKLWNCCHSSQ